MIGMIATNLLKRRCRLEKSAGTDYIFSVEAVAVLPGVGLMCWLICTRGRPSSQLFIDLEFEPSK